MPTALYKKVKGEIPDGIGVLIYYDGESTYGIRKKVECKPHQLSEETQKWLMPNATLDKWKEHHNYV